MEVLHFKGVHTEEFHCAQLVEFSSEDTLKASYFAISAQVGGERAA